MSSAADVAAPPIVAAVAFAAASFMSRQTTVAPCAAAPIATASPMPDPAPMTAAVLPVSEKSPGQPYEIPSQTVGRVLWIRHPWRVHRTRPTS